MPRQKDTVRRTGLYSHFLHSSNAFLSSWALNIGPVCLKAHFLLAPFLWGIAWHPLTCLRYGVPLCSKRGSSLCSSSYVHAEREQKEEFLPFNSHLDLSLPFTAWAFTHHWSTQSCVHHSNPLCDDGLSERLVWRCSPLKWHHKSVCQHRLVVSVVVRIFGSSSWMYHPSACQLQANIGSAG